MSAGAASHSLHGLINIRLAGAPPEMLTAVERTLGPSRGPTCGEPDIAVSFTDSFPSRSGLRFLGLNQAAFDEESFYLLDDAGRRVRLDVDELGEPCELVCEQGVTTLPLLLSIVGLRLLRKEHVLLHSCAFRYRGAGTVVAGWQKGGKTEMLLAFMAAGAQYLADEWTIISPDGRTVYGLPGIVQIWSWHLRHVPPYWKRLRRSERARLRLLRLYQRLYREMPEVGGTTDFPLAALHRLSLEGGNPLIGQVRSSPERLFGDHVSHAPSPLNRLFLATSWEGATTVRPLTGADLAHRMVSSLEWERRELMAAYDQFKYAFPDRRNDWIENAAKREHEILSRAFSSKLAHEVLHPYPVPLQDLHAVTAPLYE